ncbi:phosphate/phosphite/phosphonate ABC transporter substrate-binding protein [Rhodoferax sp. PAMC 29310]|uniref:phosphate/phosphite/phosphonate ABC transporter substrate-binding protein n=1 Tax=Rhodoferax sp. PAMC 29310 TaxID=2822760 RepID=UPI001B31BFD6|nr:phosphate/phosphite/phosphonate ABC transporter substrate-binding protein [Rhodoferax sp. PAMC 29310]
MPQLTPVEMSRYWSPVVAALGLAGIPCELVVYRTIAEFEAEFNEGRADIVYLNPYHMVMASRSKRYKALVRDARGLEGVLVVKRDGPVGNVAQLEHQTISFPAPNAFGASLYVRSVLDRHYQISFKAQYDGTHRNAVRQVLIGESAAAGVIKTTLEMEPPDVQNDLRVVYTTPALSPHPVAAHPRVPVAVRNKIIETLLSLAANPETKSVMRNIQIPNPVRADYDVDYAPLEALGIEKYVIAD